MQLHLRSIQSWRRQCEVLAEAFSIDLERHDIRIFESMAQATYESVVGLRRLYQLKKKIYFFKNQDPHLEHPLRTMAKEGLILQPLDWGVMKDSSEFIKSLDRESHFVAYSVDDPVLGFFHETDHMDQSLLEQNIFRIRISYSRHLHSEWPKIDKNTVHLLGLPDGRALGFLGDRVKFPPQGVDILDWSNADVRSYQGLKSSAREFPEQVKQFEQRSDLGFKPLLSQDKKRIFDRAAVYWPDLDSSAVLELLLTELGIGPAPAGKISQVESLSLSRWGGIKGFEWLVEQGIAKEVLRGALVIDANLLSDSFVDLLQKLRKRILEAQSGD
jgi:hypothetical protein